jgi:hypothetical protein
MRYTGKIHTRWPATSPGFDPVAPRPTLGIIRWGTCYLRPLYFLSCVAI